jgi:hypothetical protein
VQARRLREVEVRAYPHRHDDQLRRNLFTRLQADTGDVFGSENRFRVRFQPEREPLGLERLLQQVRGGAVELPLHEPRHEVNHRHVHAAQLQSIGGLQPQQPAADHDRVGVLRRCVDHRLRIADVAVGEHARQLHAGMGSTKGFEPVASSRRS